MTIDQENYYKELQFRRYQQRQNTLRNATKLLATNINPRGVLQATNVVQVGCHCTISAELMKTINALKDVIVDMNEEIEELKSRLGYYDDLQLSNQISSLNTDVTQISTDLSSLSIVVSKQTPSGQIAKLQSSIDELSSKVMNMDIELVDSGNEEQSGGKDDIF